MKHLILFFTPVWFVICGANAQISCSASFGKPSSAHTKQTGRGDIFTFVQVLQSPFFEQTLIDVTNDRLISGAMANTKASVFDHYIAGELTSNEALLVATEWVTYMYEVAGLNGNLIKSSMGIVQAQSIKRFVKL